jgi:hypothetical protein
MLRTWWYGFVAGAGVITTATVALLASLPGTGSSTPAAATRPAVENGLAAGFIDGPEARNFCTTYEPRPSSSGRSFMSFSFTGLGKLRDVIVSTSGRSGVFVCGQEDGRPITAPTAASVPPPLNGNFAYERQTFSAQGVPAGQFRFYSPDAGGEGLQIGAVEPDVRVGFSAIGGLPPGWTAASTGRVPVAPTDLGPIRTDGLDLG